jgi:plasmid maintenance system antidote protein VapI
MMSLGGAVHRGATTVAKQAEGPLARAIRERIRVSELTAYRVAKLSGVSVDSVLRFQTGQRGLTLESADKMATALGVVVSLDPDWSY